MYIDTFCIVKAIYIHGYLCDDKNYELININ